MDIKASTKYLRTSPRKVRTVLDVARGLKVDEALTKLAFLNKRAVQPVVKLINSAVANAENNFKLKKENLFIKHITAEDGPTLKRWRPRAFGRAAMIRKRTSHVFLVLSDGQEIVAADKAEKASESKKEKDEEKSVEIVEKKSKSDKVKTSKTKAEKPKKKKEAQVEEEVKENKKDSNKK